MAWVFDLETQHETARFGNHKGLSSAVLSPDARWLACSTWHGSGVKVFDAQNGKLALSVPEAINSGATFSPDGKWLAVTTGPEYRLWSVGSWEAGLRIARAETTDLPGPMVFAPDGRILAIVASWPLLRLTDVANGLELATLECPTQTCGSRPYRSAPTAPILLSAANHTDFIDCTSGTCDSSANGWQR